MRKKDLYKMAKGNLTRRKSRTFLTVLGIVIGTISIVLMIALGLGMQENFDTQLENITSINVIEVTKGDNINSTTRLSESKDNDNIGDIDLAFLEEIEGVEVVSPVITSTVKMTSGKYEATVQLIGLNTEMMDELGFIVSEGRLLNEEDETNLVFGFSAINSFKEVGDGNNNTSTKKVTMNNALSRMGKSMFSNSTKSEQEPPVDIYTERINMTLDLQYSPQDGKSANGDIYRIKGVGSLKEGDMTRDRYAYMNIETLIDMNYDYDNITETTSDEGYDKAYVKVTQPDKVDSIKSYIESYGYTASTSANFLETIQSTTDMLQIALGGIGAIALIVAAIGITNTMIMAIHERKREIGIMKVIGATVKDIKRLFLLEAAMIGFLGGVIGITISVALSKLLSSSGFNMMAMGMGGRNGGSTFSFSIPLWLIVVGLIFTTLVGITSGYIPAKQAMNSSALEAIKTE